jgi:hypothetical protein
VNREICNDYFKHQIDGEKIDGLIALFKSNVFGFENHQVDYSDL